VDAAAEVAPERNLEMVKADVERWRPVVKASGAKIN